MMKMRISAPSSTRKRMTKKIHIVKSTTVLFSVIFGFFAGTLVNTCLPSNHWKMIELISGILVTIATYYLIKTRFTIVN